MIILRVPVWGCKLYFGDDAAYYGRSVVAHLGPFLFFLGRDQG